MSVALITGASRGLGRATAHALSRRGWTLVLDARGADALHETVSGLPEDRTVAIPGDVTDPGHREALVGAVVGLGGLDLLVNNASALGPSPQPRLADYPLKELGRVYGTNVLAPFALIQALLPALAAREGTIVNVSSDAAVEAYPGWGGYGSSKAALDHLTAILAVEEPSVRVYAFDPGDMCTDMHQRAFPNEDISDRPAPEEVVPALLRLVGESPASGRYRTAELLPPVGAR